MAVSELAGLNYKLEGNSIDFFGNKGVIFDSGRWAINGFGGDLWVQVDPASIRDTVRDCIQSDVESGKSAMIAQLQLGPRQAVIFYLEGQLTREHLKKAIEGPDFIDIPGVEVEGRTLTVHIAENLTFPVATADGGGNVL